MARAGGYQRAVGLQKRGAPAPRAPPDRAMPNETHAIRALRSVASRQWACVTTQQLRAAGVSRGQIERMVERGFLIRLHRGVYALGALSPAPEQRWAAALLAAGRGAALRHSAAAGHSERLPPREVIEVVAPKRRRGDRTLRIHERRYVEIT